MADMSRRPHVELALTAEVTVAGVSASVRPATTAVGAKTAYIAPGSPWENGYIESFNACLRDELLDGEIFYTLREAQIVIESWRRHFNTIRPHESLGYKPPAPEVFVPAFAAWPAALRRPAPPATLPLAQRPTLNQHSTWTTQWGPISPGAEALAGGVTPCLPRNLWPKRSAHSG